MTATIYKAGIAEFNLLGVPDGVLYIEGRRGLLTNPSWVGRIAQVSAVDFSGSGTQSVGISIGVLVDTSYPPNTASGSAFTVNYLSLTSAGSFSVSRTDTWTAT